MTNETEDTAKRDKREMRVMWITSAVIVLLIVGAMGANKAGLWGHQPSANPPTDISSQSRVPSAT